MDQKRTFNTIDVNRFTEELLNTLPILSERIQKNCGVSDKMVYPCVAEMIRFLSLISYSNEVLTPSQFIDNVWHEFILCTKAYYNFCIKYFHCMIHHYPGGTDEENIQQYKRTLDLYHEYYGSPNPYYWGKNNHIHLKSSCGSCESN